MFQIDIELFFAIVLGLVFAFFGVYMAIYHLREKRKDERCFKTVFHCLKCGEIYVKMHRNREFANCPKCGKRNHRIGF